MKRTVRPDRVSQPKKYEVRKWLLDDPHDVQEVAINLKNKCSEAKSAEVHWLRHWNSELKQAWDVFASSLDRSSTSGDGPPTWNFYLILESVDRHQSLRSHLTFDVCFRITVDFTLILVYPLWWYNKKPVWHFVAFSQAWRATSRTTKLSGGVFFTVSTERLGDVAEELSLATAFALLRLCRRVTSRRQREKWKC